MKNSVDFSSYFHYLVLNREGKAGWGGKGGAQILKVPSRLVLLTAPSRPGKAKLEDSW